jgi:hypothetical protein
MELAGELGQAGCPDRGKDARADKPWMGGPKLGAGGGGRGAWGTGNASTAGGPEAGGASKPGEGSTVGAASAGVRESWQLQVRWCWAPVQLGS